MDQTNWNVEPNYLGYKAWWWWWLCFGLLYVYLKLSLISIQAAETTPAYPDICFAVDDFDSTSDAVVIVVWSICICYK